ncbi:uncharacterized protein LOC144345897 [Saccoglossus kowalevskii]
MVCSTVVLNIVIAVCVMAVEDHTAHNRKRGRSTALPRNLETVEQISEWYKGLLVMSEKIAVIEERLTNALQHNDYLQSTIAHQSVQIKQLQSIAESLPQIIVDNGRTEKRVDALEEKARTECICTQTSAIKGKMVPDIETTEDWVNTLNHGAVVALMRAMNNAAPRQRNRHNVSNDASQLHDARVLSKEFVKTLTKQGSGYARQRGSIDDLYTTTIQPAPSSDGDSRPTRQYLGHLPYIPRRHQRSVGSAYSQRPRNIQDGDFTDQIEEAFTKLLLDNTRVYFSAFRSETLLGSNRGPQNIVFSDAKMNYGESFDTNTGLFTCTVPGIYYFSFTIRSYEGKGIGVLLMQNDERVVAMITDSSDRKVMQTQSVVLALNHGDQIWLLLGPSDNFAIYGNDFNYNTFNGMLLHRS